MNDITQRLLTFTLADENYAIPILKVREITGVTDITPVPKTPSYVKGLINLRGNIVPVVDLRLKFGLPEQSYDEKTCIMIVEYDTQESKKLLGVAVDIVSEVVTILTEDIAPASEHSKINTDEGIFVSGIINIKDKMIIIIDIESLIVDYNSAWHTEKI